MIIVIFLAIPIARSQSADAALEVATEPFLIPQQSAPPNSPIPPATAGSGDQTSPAQNTTAEDEQRRKAQVQLDLLVADDLTILDVPLLTLLVMTVARDST